MRNRVRVMCKPGSVGDLGGQPPRSTRPGLRAQHRITREARTVSGCVNSANLNISQHFTGHLFRPWIPSSARDTGLRARHRITREARTVSGCVNSANLNISQHFTGHLFRPWIPSLARGIDGGPRRFTEVVFNELSLPVAGSGRVQETLPEPVQ